jgi:predicted nucleic acid-binding protein
MKVFADSKFLISAFSTRGLSADVLQLVLSKHELITAESVLQELRSFFTKSLKLPLHFALEIEHLLRRHQVDIHNNSPNNTTPPYRATFLDNITPSENAESTSHYGIIIPALRSRADVVISGNLKLLDSAHEIHEIHVISPREFWELVRSKGEP